MTEHKIFDVAVVGAGVFGAWTAYQLQQTGASVILVDAYGPGNSRSSSGGESRIIRMGYGPDEIYTSLARRSLELWREFLFRSESTSKPIDEPLFQQTGVLWLAHENDRYCEATFETLERMRIRLERLSSLELSVRYPQLNLEGIEWGILEPESGALMARRAVRAVAGQARTNGVTLGLMSALPPTGTGRVESLSTVEGNKIPADKFVFACGPWLPKLFPDLLGDLIRVTRQEVFFFGIPKGDDSYALGQMPIWVDFSDMVYAFPNLENRGFKIAIDAHGSEFDPDSGDRVVTATGLSAVREYLKTRVPALASAPVTETRVCQYENTSNGDFLIDRHPDFENVWLVGGGSGHGFKHGPAVAEYVVAMLSDSEDVEPRFTLSSKKRVHQREVF
jgi:sarcosine oxidase